MDNEVILSLINKMLDDNIVIEYEKIPEIDLYMDQLTTFLDEKLKTYKRRDDDKILTKTMINNYSKDKILPPSENKKYSREHMALLIMVFHLKYSLAFNDIGALYKILREKKYSYELLYKAFIEIQRIENEQTGDELKHKIASLEPYSSPDNENNLAILTIFSLLIDANNKKRLAEMMIDEITKK